MGIVVVAEEIVVVVVVGIAVVAVVAAVGIVVADAVPPACSCVGIVHHTKMLCGSTKKRDAIGVPFWFLEKAGSGLNLRY